MEKPARLEDRRRFPRTDSSLPLQYKNLRNSGVASVGSLAKDISAGGVCFKTNEFLSLACRLVVEINLPTTAKPIKAISKVAWIKKVPTGDYYELGNQFLEISKDDKAQIMDFVSKALSTGI